MFKFLVLALFVVCSSAFVNFRRIQALVHSTNPNFTLQFIQGFNHQLKIDSDVNFNNCTNIPIINDLNKTLHDLNKTNISYAIIAEDVYRLYKDSNGIKKYCPQAEATYGAYFANFSSSVKSNPKQTWSNVWKNVNGNWEQFLDLIAKLETDFQKELGYQSGVDFGSLVAIALKGYINDTSAATVAANANFTLQFIQGFNHQLKIDTDVNFNNCTDIPIIADVNKTIHDFNQTNYVAIAEDIAKLYKDANGIKHYCPQAEATYKAFFANFTQSLKKDPKHTLANVWTNVNTNLDQVDSLAQQVSTDFQKENGYQAGEDVGQIVAIALKGYVSK